MANHLLSSPVDEGGAFHVWCEKGVDRVVLRQLAVHADHGGFEHHVRVTQMGNHFVDSERTKNTIRLDPRERNGGAGILAKIP